MTPVPHLWQYLLFLLLFLAGLTAFYLRMRDKVGMLTRLARADRFDRPGERLKGVLLHALGQGRVLRDPATGLMHAFIFWGFCVLAVHTASVFSSALLRLDVEHWLGPVYAYPRDVFILLVAVMVLYAAFRRAVLRPERVESSGEAYLVLGLILLLMVIDMAMAGAHEALHRREPASTEAASGFLGAAIAPLLGGLDRGTLSTLWHTGFWLQATTILAFLNLLPGSKHFHVLTSLFDVYVRKLEPAGKLRTLNLEDENAESFGVSKLHELDWKVLLDVYSCTECGRCHELCPTHVTNKPLSPKRMNDNLKAIAYAHEKEVAAGKAASLPDLFAAGVVKPDEVWACTTCGYCEEACPLFIEQVQWIADFRRYKTLTESEFPTELTRAFKGLENNSNPWGIGADRRAEWAEGLDVPVVGEGVSFEYLYYVGCSGSFDERSKKVARAFAALLKRAGVSFAILGEAEGCCGDAARRAGNEYLFQTLAQANVEAFREAGVKKIVTTCPHGYNTLKNEYPDFGGRYEVVHHTELLQRLLHEGRLKPARSFDHRVAFHDSCYLGRYNSVYEQPRDVLRGVPGLTLREMEPGREKGFCCGGGGGRIFMEESLGTRINHTRVEHARRTGCDVVASACPFCLTMLEDGVKEKEVPGVEVRDVAEILLEAMEDRKA